MGFRQQLQILCWLILPSLAFAQPVGVSSMVAKKLRYVTTLPSTCVTGEIHADSDATSGQRVYLCESANTWVLQGDGGGGGSGDVTDVGDCATGSCFTGTSGNTLTFKGATSGTTALKPTAVAGTTTITMPAETGTMCTTGSVCSGYAPSSADYITGSAQSGLSAEQSLGALTTGLLLNTVAASTGTVSAYGGTSCTNQFPRSLNASGAATCASVGAADITDGVIDGTELASNTKIVSFGITIDGGGSAITTGIKGYIEIPFAMTITQSTFLCDQSGSIVTDLWKDSYANYPPVDADSITASAPPTISSATKSQDSTLTGWTTSISAGDVIGFNVDSITTVQRCHLIIRGNKS